MVRILRVDTSVRLVLWVICNSQSPSQSDVTVLMYYHAFEAYFALTLEGMIGVYNSFLGRSLSVCSNHQRMFAYSSYLCLPAFT